MDKSVHRWLISVAWRGLNSVVSHFINSRGRFDMPVYVFTPNDVFCTDTATKISFYALICLNKFTNNFWIYQLIKYSQNKNFLKRKMIVFFAVSIQNMSTHALVNNHTQNGKMDCDWTKLFMCLCCNWQLQCKQQVLFWWLLTNHRQRLTHVWEMGLTEVVDTLFSI